MMQVRDFVEDDRFRTSDGHMATKFPILTCSKHSLYGLFYLEARHSTVLGACSRATLPMLLIARDPLLFGAASRHSISAT